MFTTFIYTYVQVTSIQTNVLYYSPNGQLNRQPASESATGKKPASRILHLRVFYIDLVSRPVFYDLSIHCFLWSSFVGKDKKHFCITFLNRHLNQQPAAESATSKKWLLKPLFNENWPFFFFTYFFFIFFLNFFKTSMLCSQSSFILTSKLLWLRQTFLTTFWIGNRQVNRQPAAESAPSRKLPFEPIEHLYWPVAFS